MKSWALACLGIAAAGAGAHADPYGVSGTEPWVLENIQLDRLTARSMTLAPRGPAAVTDAVAGNRPTVGHGETAGGDGKAWSDRRSDGPAMHRNAGDDRAAPTGFTDRGFFRRGQSRDEAEPTSAGSATRSAPFTAAGRNEVVSDSGTVDSGSVSRTVTSTSPGSTASASATAPGTGPSSVYVSSVTGPGFARSVSRSSSSSTR